MLSGAYLRANMGGLVTAVKPEEISLWKGYAAEHGREKSLVVLDEHEGFNFLHYELARHGVDGIGTITESLMNTLDFSKKASATASQRGGEAFWEDASRQAVRYTVPAIYAATGSVSVPDIIRFITTAPTNLKEPTDAEWQRRSFMYSVMDAAARAPQVPLARSTLHNCISYWSEEFPATPDRTRGNIVASVTTALDRFKHGRLNKVFCGKTTVVPEMTFNGAVILLGMPTLSWNEDGIIAQQIFKRAWQRAVLSRNGLPPKYRERPLFLYSDEAQETAQPQFDGDFLGLCRGSLTSVCFMSQSLPAYIARAGGDNPRDAANSLVGKFGNLVFHANSCPETNDFASRVIGKVVKRRANYSKGTSRSTNRGMSMGSSETEGTSITSGTSYTSSNGGNESTSYSSSVGTSHSTGNNWGVNRGNSHGTNESTGYSESMEFLIEPGEFARGLKTGGKANNYEVTGVWFQAGRVFEESGSNVLLARFKQ